MPIDHQKNLLVLENLDYIKKFYDVDENKESYSVTETGIKALIAWSKIHGFEDKLGVVMALALQQRRLNKKRGLGIFDPNSKSTRNVLGWRY